MLLFTQLYEHEQNVGINTEHLQACPDEAGVVLGVWLVNYGSAQ
jgi:hypothetical protein